MLSSRSSRYFLMYGAFIRAVTFQSMLRISSPGSYSRTSSKSSPEPRKTLRYVPMSASSARIRALISTCLTSRRTSGGTCPRCAAVAGLTLGDRFVHVHLPDGGPGVEDGRRGGELPRDRRLLDRVAVHDHPLLVGRRVTDDDLHHETVDLRFGEAVGALVLDRVLGREHREELGQRMGLPAYRDLTFLHRLEECALHLRRSPVDLV